MTLPQVINDIYEQLGRRWYEAYDDPVALLRAEAKLKNPWIANEIQTHLGNESLDILDIGCGGGFLTNYLALRNHKVSGLDLSPSSLAVAKNADESKSVNYVLGDAYELPFADQAFSVVTCMDFLEHVDEPERVVREASRVLKPGGLFIFHTFNRNWFAKILVIHGVEWFVKNTPKDMHVYHLFIRPQELESFCNANRMFVSKWQGIRPKLFTLDMVKALRTGIVPKSFTFAFTKSLLVSYAGIAVKKA
jgi:2-polyprenyl-6-hydroxyphenyl methylase/3-demethylubiquinone-9 3-methyltransferase